MVNFWHHVSELPETSFASLALKENIEIRTNWIKTIEKIINIFNLAQHVDIALLLDLRLKKSAEISTEPNGRK